MKTPKHLTKKAFREHLNRAYPADPTGANNHREGRYQQRTRGYGDYLYAQDRGRFNVDYAEWLASSQPTPETT